MTCCISAIDFAWISRKSLAMARNEQEYFAQLFLFDNSRKIEARSEESPYD